VFETEGLEVIDFGVSPAREAVVPALDDAGLLRTHRRALVASRSRYALNQWDLAHVLVRVDTHPASRIDLELIMGGESRPPLPLTCGSRPACSV
jgi:hypothetical protein